MNNENPVEKRNKMRAEKLIAEMETEETDFMPNTIGIYFKLRSDRIDGAGYVLFASLQCSPECYALTMEEKFPYNREDLRTFTEWALGQRDEAYWEPKLIWWKKRGD